MHIPPGVTTAHLRSHRGESDERNLTIQIRLAWWFIPWLRGLLFFCGLMGREPDLKKVQAMVKRAIRFTFPGRRPYLIERAKILWDWSKLRDLPASWFGGV